LFDQVFDAFATAEVLLEYRLAIRSRTVRADAIRRGLPETLVADYLDAIEATMQLVEPGPEFYVSDPDDIKYTAASTGAHADYLVASDQALLDLGEVLEARVVTPEAFLEELERG
jgi:predicted nucleic acid-binding protein